MDITLEQAKAFNAISINGTIQKAAKSLNKGHSSILYLIKTLESQVRLELFDRSHYRNKISPQGEVVLRYCKKLIEIEEELYQTCHKLQSGWESSLKLIYDAVIDFNIIANALYKLNEAHIPTEINVLSAHLNEVETFSRKENADIMVTTLPIRQPEMRSIALKPLKMLLVAHQTHLLTKYKVVSTANLQNHTHIKLKEPSKNLGFSTEKMTFNSSFLVNDFFTKKQALLKGLGYGWLPEYLIQDELKTKEIKVLKTKMQNTHILHPKLYHRKDELIGKTTKELLKHFEKK